MSRATVSFSPGCLGRKSPRHSRGCRRTLTLEADASGPAICLLRAEPFAAQVLAGNVFFVPGPWVLEFLEEAERFPYGTFKDQIDAAAGAFARLSSRPVYNLAALGS
jgi:phage terminase large subunit-like protein